MKLDYGTLLSPLPIKLSIGTLKKPKLIEIAELNFDKFNLFEFFLKITPFIFYTKLKGEEGIVFWEHLTEKKKKDLTLYDVVLSNEELKEIFLEIFNFFFIEKVIFKEGLFWVLTKDITQDFDIEKDVRGIINKNNFIQVLDIIQQICCINDGYQETDIKFKNKIAKKIYLKLQSAQHEQKKKNDVNLSLPNIISAVSNNHLTITPTNVWELSIFQLLDSFSRLQVNFTYYVNLLHISVWGDKNKTFNNALWYINNYDKQNN